jgi:hypothetical protein
MKKKHSVISDERDEEIKDPTYTEVRIIFDKFKRHKHKELMVSQLTQKAPLHFGTEFKN